MSGDSLDGKVAIVTGAARGIGRCIAESLGRRGARVVLAARSTVETPSKALPGNLEDVESKLRTAGVDVIAIRTDLSREEDCIRLADETLRRFGRCDILVNNAAVSFLGGFEQLPPRRWTVVFNVNVLGPVILTQCVIPGMVERGEGRIVNISSGHAVSDDHDPENHILQLPYAATKAALERFSTGLSSEYAAHSVAVNCLRVDGVVPTEAVTYAAPELSDQGVCTPEEFGEATANVLTQPLAFSGYVLTLEHLIQRGFLQTGSAV